MRDSNVEHPAGMILPPRRRTMPGPVALHGSCRWSQGSGEPTVVAVIDPLETGFDNREVRASSGLRLSCNAIDDMAGWLSGFRSADAVASTDPQPFELVCECNVRHSGLRRKTHQRITCRSCGASLFVLPRDVYPPLPDVGAIKKKPKPKRNARELDPDEPAPVRVSRTKRRRQEAGSESHPFAAAANVTSAALTAAAGAAARSTRATARKVSSAGVNTAVGFYKFWTPLRLAGLGMCVLLAALALWTIRSRRIETAQRNLNPAIEEGLAALARGEIPVAAQRLQTAQEALDLLQLSDRHSQSVRQVAREAQALNRLVTEPLPGLLEQADEAVTKAAARRPKPTPEDNKPPPLDADWVIRFGALYQGAWVGLEAPVRKLPPTPDEPHRYEVEFPLAIGPRQRPVELRADFEVFERLGIGDSPRTVAFAGRLESLRFDETAQTFRIVLARDSGFLWVNLPTYRRLGFTFSEWHPQSAVEALLAAQAGAVGVDALVQEEPVTAPQLGPQLEAATP